MTHFKQFFLMLLTAAVLISCGKDDDQEDQNTSNATFFAKIEGTDYRPEFINGFLIDSAQTILVSGETGTGQAMQLFIPAATVAGTYDFDNGFIGNYQRTDEDGDFGFAVSGSITITAHDTAAKTISGTFSFNTSEFLSDGSVFTITAGSFSTGYVPL